jgi:hypothetical protein
MRRLTMHKLPSSFRNPAAIRNWLPLIAVGAVRLTSIAVLPLEGLVGYGDYRHFFNLSQFALSGGGGLPFLGHWVEFPPLFPFLSLLLYQLSAGQFHTYAALLAVLMALFDLGSLWLFSVIAREAQHGEWNEVASWIYAIFLMLPAFGWWTFEPMAVFWMMLAILGLVKKKPLGLGLAAGFGFLTKFIPALPLLVAWRRFSLRQAFLATAAALLIIVLALGPLLASNPSMTAASLRAQFSKSSWETVWALLDGNLRTGNLGPLSERLDPGASGRPLGNAPRIPTLIPTLLLGGLCIWALLGLKQSEPRSWLILLTYLLGLVFLWSRGWSPQWLAYLLPLLLFSLPIQTAAILAANLILISILEWPILLSRGRFDLLWVPVIVRTLLILVMTIEAGRRVLCTHNLHTEGSEP